MVVSYNRLWKPLIDKSITKTKMRKFLCINTIMLTKIKKNESVSVSTLEKIETIGITVLTILSKKTSILRMVVS